MRADNDNEDSDGGLLVLLLVALPFSIALWALLLKAVGFV